MNYWLPLKRLAGRSAIALSLLSASSCAAFETPLEKKLLGQWSGEVSPTEKGTLIFTEEGKLFILQFSEPPVALKSMYQIALKPKPMLLDVNGGEETSGTILEVTDANKLSLELKGIKAVELQPTVFSASLPLFNKISETTNLPANTQIKNIQNEVNKAKQAEGRQYLGAMNRRQEAYYLEKGKFGTTIEDLGVGIKRETQSYHYQILPQGDGTKSVIMTAIAKIPGIVSYTSAVFAVKQTSGQTLTQAIICETEQPSNVPPAMLTISADASAIIQCPTGSRDIRR